MLSLKLAVGAIVVTLGILLPDGALGPPARARRPGRWWRS